MRAFAVSMMLCAACLAQDGAAQTTAPAAWSEVTGQQWSGLSKERAGAVIRRVDGRYAAYDARVKIAPGERDVVVRSPSRRGFSGTDRHLRLLAEPCRRYYVNAQFRSTTGTDWEPVVAKTEPIIGCHIPARD